MSTRDDGSHTSPPLAPGTRISHYEIIGPLGRGGMGVVYRARDSRLSRVVALKRSASDPGRDLDRRRFLREAKLAARLSSPFIVPVFEIVEADGVPWLAMELVEGSTLRDILSKNGGLSVRESVRYGEHVAEALSVAHAKRVLHRDVKPGNIIVTHDGRARLMDFGLARPFVLEDELEQVETESEPITREGVVGTTAYMSPEQVLGRSLDARTDIFSLGSVVYEMVTGRRPFRGDSHGSLRDAIVNRTPMPMTELTSDVPDELERMTRKMLAKSPEDRYPDARSLAVDFRTLRRDLSGSSATTRSGRVETRDRSRTARSPALLRAILLLLLLFATFVTIRTMSRRADGEWLVDTASVSRLVSWSSRETNGRVSPNGEWLSFISDRGEEERADLWVVRAGGGEPTQLTADEEPVASHVWSPDGTEVAYLSGSPVPHHLTITPAPVSGRPRLKRPLAAAFLVRWRNDGIYAIAAHASSLRVALLIDPAGEESPDTLDVFPEGLLHDFDVSPFHDGVVASVSRGGQQDLWAADAMGAPWRQLTEDPHVARHPRWLGPGGDRVIFVSNRSGQFGVWELHLADGASRTTNIYADWLIVDDVSPDGELVMLSTRTDRSDSWFLRGETLVPAIDEGQGDHAISSSSIASRVAIQRRRMRVEEAVELLNAEILVADYRDDRLVDERKAVADGFAPVLSSDGSRVAYLRASADYRRTELRVDWLESGRSELISDDVEFLGFAWEPTNLRTRTCVWADSDPTLYYVRRDREDGSDESGRDELVRWQPDAAEAVLHRAGVDEVLYDPLVDEESGRVHVIAWNIRAQSFRLLRVDAVTGAVSDSDVPTLPATQQVRLLGRSRTSLLLAAAETTASWDQRGLFIAVDADLEPAIVDTFDSAFIQTSLVTRDGAELLITRSEDDIENAYAYEIGARSWRRLTRNQVRGVTYADYAELRDGTIMCVRQEVRRDVWTLASSPGR